MQRSVQILPRRLRRLVSNASAIVETLGMLAAAVLEVLMLLAISALLLIVPPLLLVHVLSEGDSPLWVEGAAWCLLFASVLVFFWNASRWLFLLARSLMDTAQVLYRLTGIEDMAHPDRPEEVFIFTTRSGTRYHLSHCPFLDRSKISLLREQAREMGLKPCRACKPDEDAQVRQLKRRLASGVFSRHHRP